MAREVTEFRQTGNAMRFKLKPRHLGAGLSVSLERIPLEEQGQGIIHGLRIYKEELKGKKTVFSAFPDDAGGMKVDRWEGLSKRELREALSKCLAHARDNKKMEAGMRTYVADALRRTHDASRTFANPLATAPKEDVNTDLRSYTGVDIELLHNPRHGLKSRWNVRERSDWAKGGHLTTKRSLLLFVKHQLMGDILVPGIGEVEVHGTYGSSTRDLLLKAEVDLKEDGPNIVRLSESRIGKNKSERDLVAAEILELARAAVTSKNDQAILAEVIRHLRDRHYKANPLGESAELPRS